MDKKTTPNNNSRIEENDCKVHIMPSLISDEDVNALFNGLVNIVKKKIEIETQAQIIDINMNMQKLVKELKSKQAECNRLKNEIIYLKSKFQNNIENI